MNKLFKNFVLTSIVFFCVSVSVVNAQKLSQRVNFPAFPEGACQVGDGDYNPKAFATSGLPVTYSTSDTTIASIVNGRIHFKAGGNCYVYADQLGNDLYNSAHESQILYIMGPETSFPAPWQCGVINTFLSRGSWYNTNNNQYLITASPDDADIWGKEDKFSFIYTNVEGNCEISVKLGNLTSYSPLKLAKAGIMIRSNLYPGAKFALLYQNLQKQIQMDQRNTFAQPAIHVSNLIQTETLVKYLKIKRVGNIFSTYYSVTSNSGPWNFVASTTIIMPSNVYIGMVATAQQPLYGASARFSDIKYLKSEVENNDMAENSKLNASKTETKIEVYPNPAVDVVNVQVKSKVIENFIIYDANGKEVYFNSNITSDFTINTSQIGSKGTYIIKADDQTTKLVNLK